MFLTAICSLTGIVYCAIIIAYYRWFKKLQPFQSQKTINHYRFFSIIIPARNEAENIANCLASVFANNYPITFFEVIVIDDFSTDETNSIVQSLQKKYSNLKLLHLAELLGKTTLNAYKKKAIELAVAEAKGDWLVTTDADCIVPKKWLLNFNDYINQTDAIFIAAPVSFINNYSFLSIFQCLDFISLQGITAAAVSANFHSMCNGANLAYNKAAFYAAGGFAGIDNIASGDDMLLMYKIKKSYPGKTGFLFSPESIVQTTPMLTWKDFFNQRIRWASKGNKYDDKKIFAVLAVVYLFNVSLLAGLILYIFLPKRFIFWLIILAVKTICELIFMLPVARFFNQQKLLFWFPLMQPFHIVYTVFAGWLGLFGKYKWKGRMVK